MVHLVPVSIQCFEPFEVEQLSAVVLLLPLLFFSMRATLHGLVRLVPLVLSLRAGTYFTATAKFESCNDRPCDTVVLEVPVAHFGEESVSCEMVPELGWRSLLL